MHLLKIKSSQIQDHVISLASLKNCWTIFVALFGFIVICIAAINGQPSKFAYNYRASVGGDSHHQFELKAKVNIEVAFEENSGGDNKLIRLNINEPQLIIANHPNQAVAFHDKSFQIYLYAHLSSHPNGTAKIETLYTHYNDSTTSKNLKKTILINLIPPSHHKVGQHMIHIDDNNVDQPELFSPDSISQVSILAEPRSENNHKAFIFKSVFGNQNVTFRSRVFSEAESNLTTSFELELLNELELDPKKAISAGSIKEAISDTLGDPSGGYSPETIGLRRERKVCIEKHCRRKLSQLFQDYKASLSDDSLASNEASMAFLRLVARVRDTKASVGLEELLNLLTATKKQDNGAQGSLLDIFAAARTRSSISASLKHLNLAKSKNLDVAERFLSILSVSAKTAAKMNLNRPLRSPYYSTTTSLKRSQEAKRQQAEEASLEFVAEELLRELEQIPKWASKKLRWSTMLALATIINANYRHSLNLVIEVQIEQDELSQRVSKLVLKELKGCKKSETDCRIVSLQAIGNVGYLGDEQFEVLRHQALGSGRRESVAAMKVLRDLLQNQSKAKQMTQQSLTRLKNLLLRVVYDGSQETTARVLASEMIVRFVPNSLDASKEILRHLASFGNNELATMIYSRMQSFCENGELPNHHENWFWKSSIINGSSTSFIRQMAKTESLNASYGVNVELLNRGKLLKESSFDLFLDTRKQTEDLFSLGIFARGLSSFAGGDDQNSSDDESAMAGMSLRLLGGYLRPYIFFDGTGELMSLIWSGIGSEPITAFSGNLLLIDHDEGYPLISGFVVEQQMRGVLSIDVSGTVSISVWRMESHSNVRTRASVIVEASQSIFTSQEDLWSSHSHSFGGEALIDFLTDSSFASTPFQICLQVTQPEFVVNYNSSKQHRLMGTSKVILSEQNRNYPVGAKSYPLNAENNNMCNLMNNGGFLDD